MSTKVVVTKDHLQHIGEAIIAKGGATAPMKPSEMAGAIEAIPSGGTDGPEPWVEGGGTHIWVDINENLYSRYVVIYMEIVGGPVTANFGDGTETVYSGGTTVRITMSHEYTKFGRYRIDITGYSKLQFNSTPLFFHTISQMDRSAVTQVQTDCVFKAYNNNSTYLFISRMRNLRYLRMDNRLFKGSIGYLPALAMIYAPYSGGASTISMLGLPALRETRGIDGGQPAELVFANNYSVSDVVIPEGVTTISSSAFAYCYALRSVVIPRSVTTISNMFCYDTTTTECLTAKIYATNPPTLGAQSFKNAGDRTVDQLKIYVPKGCADAYKSAVNWSVYSNVIFEMDENGNIVD